MSVLEEQILGPVGLPQPEYLETQDLSLGKFLSHLCLY